MSVTLESVLFMRKELLRQSAFHQEYKRSHNGTYVRHICKIGVRTKYELYGVETVDWED